jgi:hypothetical protein
MMEANTETDARLKRFFWPLVALILIIGLAFRLYGIASRSLWIDELFSEWFASRSFAELWHDVPTYETHPPTYYIVLKLWRSFTGDSELGLRSLSLIASMLTILTVAVSSRIIGMRLLSDGTSLLGAALVSVNFANIRDAQNARPYALQTWVCTVAVLAAIVLVCRVNRESKQKYDWGLPALVLGLAAGVSLWLHNTGLFITFGIWCGLGLSLIITRSELRLRNFGIFLTTAMLALVVWSPYVPVFVNQAQAFKGLTFWLEPKPRDLYSAWFLLLGDSWPAILLGLLLLMAGLIHLFRRVPAVAVVVAAILIVPLYTMLAVSFSIKPIYIQRLFAWMVPLSLTIIAYWIVTLTRWRFAAVILALVVVMFSVFSGIKDAGRPIDDWKGIVAEISRHAQPHDVVIAVAAEGSIAVDYYARQQANFPPIICVPGCYPQRNLARAYISNLGAPAIVSSDRQIIDQALQVYGRVWLVEVSVALYDPTGIVRSRISDRRGFVRYYGNSLARVDLFE